MNYKIIDITKTQFGELSTIPGCVFVDHYIFIDPISGSNIFYPITANGGRLDPDTAYTPTWILSTGPLSEVCYQDFCFSFTFIEPIKIFCETSVVFVLSSFDESVSEITKIVYDFGDGSEILEVNYNFISNPPVSPKDILISKKYIPTSKYVTTYNAYVSVVKNDSCVNTLLIPLCCFQCGIVDMYDDVSILNAQVTTIPSNVLLTLEQERQDQIFNTLLLTNEPTTIIGAESALPDVVNPIDTIQLLKASTPIPSTPIPPSDINPLIPPTQYLYTNCVGLIFNIPIAGLIATQEFRIKDDSLTLSFGGAPYSGGSGIVVAYECPAAAATPTQVPSTPFIYDIESPTVSSIFIYFVTDEDGSLAQNYEYSIDGGLTFFTFNPPQSAEPLIVIESNNDVTILPNTSYTIFIRGVNYLGTGGTSNPAVITTLGYVTNLTGGNIITFNLDNVVLL